VTAQPDAPAPPERPDPPARGLLHHVELWVADLGAVDGWAWLLGELGFQPRGTWADGVSWTGPGGAYLVVESGPDVRAERYDRRRPGLNHLAFWAGSEADVDRLVAAGPEHGWTPLFADRYPSAGGPDHYAGYLENTDGFEVELVAHPAAADERE